MAKLSDRVERIPEYKIAFDMQKGGKIKRLKLEDEEKLNPEIIPNKEFVPRDYQSEILEYAKKENIIVCLGTGTGKTYIAVMLMKHFLHQTRSDYKGDGKRTIFLVPTIPLVKQQADVIRRHLPDVKVGEHFGEMTVELTNKDRWQKEIEDKNIFVMVAEEFRLLVHHAFIPLSKINLIVMDECHRAVKSHPYREMMRCFDNCDLQNRPHVLGLTATLVNGKCKPCELEQHILSLERTLYSVVVTAESSEAMRIYGTDPKECISTYPIYKNDDQIFTQVIKVLINALTKFTKDSSNNTESDDLVFYTQPRQCISSILHIATNLGPWCAFHSSRVMLDEICRIPRSKDNELILFALEENLKIVYTLCERILKDNSSVYAFSSPKLKRLLDILREVNNYFVTNRSEYSQGKISSLCGIIFVRQRLSAYVLHSWLNSISEKIKDYSFLKTNFVIGHGQQQQNILIPNLNTLTHKKQEKVIKDFCAKKYNFLISTSVLEEGIDVPKCNVVIRFDPPEDIRAYIQSKGRARAADAMYILMVSENEKLKFMDDLTNFRQVEKNLETYCLERRQPTEEESLEANSYDEILPPYMPVKKDGAPRITMQSAINLIYRYCSTLPCDRSSQLLPKWETSELQKDMSSGTICTLRLPVNSAVKEPLSSPVMKNKRFAKMAAALKMCEKLHKIGELDENLLPVGNKVDKYITELLGDIKPEISKSNNRRKRCLYEKEMPDILQQNCFEEPEGRIHFFLYSIEMSFAPNSDLTELKEYEKIEGCHNFGILTTKPLPQLCTFPIFSSKSGLKINVNIDIACSDTYLDDVQLNDILCFHQYMFSDVLQLGKGRLLFDPENSKFKILIAPIIKDGFSTKYYLDWLLISTICEHSCLGEEQLKEKNRTLLKPESYVGALVYPWHYRDLKEKIYFYVKKIELDMTPESPFPDSEYHNYIEYFDKKYDVKVTKRDQFLLFVNPISASLPTEKSRYENQYGKPCSKQTKKAQQRSIRLPPELCVISPVPFSLYRKALCLPVVLHRMSGFLRAEQLRVEVAKDIGIGLSNISKDFKWIGFEFGEEYLKKSARDENTYLHFEHNQNTYNSVHRSLDLKVPNMIRMGSNFVSKINLDFQVPLDDHPGPSPGMLLTALTLRSANDGMNLERLEVVGDSFLKYAISVFLHCTYKDLDEGKLTTLKTYLIRNSYLLQLGKKRELHRLIAAVKYEGRGNWIPPCYVLSCCEQQEPCNEKSSTKENQNYFLYTKQRIPDKSIADCVEALIGAYLLSCGPYGALKFMSWLGMNVFNICLPDEPCLMFGNYPWLNYTVKDPCHISSNTMSHELKSFQKKIGYTFKNEIYLIEAFTHATFNPPLHYCKTDCYQRLEFLGDALLDYIVMRYLYEDPKNHTPGILSDIRAALVNNHFFATLATKYNYHQCICYNSTSLFQVIEKFVKKVTSQEIDVGQCSYNIEEAETDDIEEIDVPKALADVFESVAGAIYIDSGMSLEEVWKVYYPMIKPGLENFCTNVPKPPVRQLFELFPERIKFERPKLSPGGIVHVKVTVKEFGEFEGRGPNKLVAKQAAAKRALCALQNHN